MEKLITNSFCLTHMDHSVVKYSGEIIEKLPFSSNLVGHYQSYHSFRYRPPGMFEGDYDCESDECFFPFTYYVITFCLFLNPLPPSVIKFGIG